MVRMRIGSGCGCVCRIARLVAQTTAGLCPTSLHVVMVRSRPRVIVYRVISALPFTPSVT